MTVDKDIDTIFIRLHGYEPLETVGMVRRLPSGAEWWVRKVGGRQWVEGRADTHMEAATQAAAAIKEHRRLNAQDQCELREGLTVVVVEGKAW